MRELFSSYRTFCRGCYQQELRDAGFYNALGFFSESVSFRWEFGVTLG